MPEITDAPLTTVLQLRAQDGSITELISEFGALYFRRSDTDDSPGWMREIPAEHLLRFGMACVDEHYRRTAEARVVRRIPIGSSP